MTKHALENLIQWATRDHGGRRNSTLICAPIIADSVEQMVSQMRKAKELGADLVEARLDFLKDFNPKQHLQTLINNRPLPTLITYRSTNSVFVF